MALEQKQGHVREPANKHRGQTMQGRLLRSDGSTPRPPTMPAHPLGPAADHRLDLSQCHAYKARFASSVPSTVGLILRYQNIHVGARAHTNSWGEMAAASRSGVSTIKDSWVEDATGVSKYKHRTSRSRECKKVLRGNNLSSRPNIPAPRLGTFDGRGSLRSGRLARASSLPPQQIPAATSH